MINALTTTMTDLETARVEKFVLRWEKAGGKERANYQMFFAEMYDALGSIVQILREERSLMGLIIR